MTAPTLRSSLRQRVLRLGAVGCLVLGVLLVFVAPPSYGDAPTEVGWWSRQLPFQGDASASADANARRANAVPAVSDPAVSDPAGPDPTGADPTGAGPTFGPKAAGAVRFSPSQVPDTTVPGSGPVTTVPLPAPVPTVPTPPVTLPPSPGPGTPNPSVPEGGLWVANDPTGPAAISALRFAGDIGSGRLTLTFAAGSTVVGPMVICPSLVPFTPVAGGAWSDRPADDCSRLSISGIIANDGLTVSFDIPQGFAAPGADALDILVLPSPISGDPFSLYFEAPSADALEVFAANEFTEPPPPATIAEPPVFDVSTVGAPNTTTTTTVVVVEPITEIITVTTSEDATSSGGQEVAGGGLTEPISQTVEAITESRTGRILALAVLLAMGGALYWLSEQPIRSPRLLGAVGGGAPVVPDGPVDTGRGIGRFRRDRATPPGRL